MASYQHIKKCSVEQKDSPVDVEVSGNEQVVVDALTNFLNGSADGSFRLMSRQHRLPKMRGKEADVVWILRRKGKTRIMLRLR